MTAAKKAWKGKTGAAPAVTKAQAKAARPTGRGDGRGAAAGGRGVASQRGGQGRSGSSAYTSRGNLPSGRLLRPINRLIQGSFSFQRQYRDASGAMRFSPRLNAHLKSIYFPVQRAAPKLHPAFLSRFVKYLDPNTPCQEAHASPRLARGGASNPNHARAIAQGMGGVNAGGGGPPSDKAFWMGLVKHLGKK